jgi:AsmA protein
MSKRRFGLLPILAAGGLVAVGAGLYYAAARVLDPARLTAELQAAVHRATGRDLSIAGPVHLSLGLAPSLTVQDIGLSNIQGGSRPQMLTAHALRADVALLPLLTGEAVVESLTIVQPDILLERAPDGTPNWVFIPHRALYQGTPPGEPSGGNGGTHVEIHTLHVDGGQVTWMSPSGAKLALAIDSLTATNESTAAPVTLDIMARHDGAPLTLHAVTGSLDRLQGGPVSAMAGSWPLTVQVNAGDAYLKIVGGIAHPDQLRGYIFALTGNIPDVGAIASYFPGVSLPPLKDVNLSARLSDGTSGEWRTSQLSVHAGAADLSSWAAGLSIQQALLSAPGPGQNMQLNIDGFYASAPLHLAVTAMQPDLLSQNAPVAATLSGQAGGADFTAKGTVPPALGASGLDLTVSAHTADLSELSALVGRTLPPAHDVQFEAHAEDAGFKLRGVTLRDLTLSSSVAQIAGTATVIWSPRPALNGTLAASHLDLDALFPAFSVRDAVFAPDPAPPVPAAAPPSVVAPSVVAPSVVAPAPPAPPAEAAPARVISAHPLNFAPLRGADADLTLTAGAVTAGGEVFRDVSGHFTLADGKAALNPFRFSANGGVLVGGASIDAGADAPPVAVSLRASSFPAALLASLAGVPGGATGAVQLDVQLSGAGQTPQALAATLDGHAGLSMVNGALDGALLGPLLTDTLGAAGLPLPDVGSTPVRCLALRAEFAHGIADMQALSVDTPKLSLDGSGDIDLASENFGLHLVPDLHAGPLAATAPVSLTGPFAAPKAALDRVGGRVGFSLGGDGSGPPASDCASKLSVARGGAPGPMPVQAASPAAQNFPIRKPKDLLKGLFH